MNCSFYKPGHNGMPVWELWRTPSASLLPKPRNSWCKCVNYLDFECVLLRFWYLFIGKQFLLRFYWVMLVSYQHSQCIFCFVCHLKHQVSRLLFPFLLFAITGLVLMRDNMLLFLIFINTTMIIWSKLTWAFSYEWRKLFLSNLKYSLHVANTFEILICFLL